MGWKFIRKRLTCTSYASNIVSKLSQFLCHKLQTWNFCRTRDYWFLKCKNWSQILVPGQIWPLWVVLLKTDQLLCITFENVKSHPKFWFSHYVIQNIDQGNMFSITATFLRCNQSYWCGKLMVKKKLMVQKPRDMLCSYIPMLIQNW